jgi:tripartite-type tricarboxylate transporter receptor subunit TctC
MLKLFSITTRRGVLGIMGAAAAGLGLLATGSPVTAADFSGKTIEIIVPVAAGGGTDLWSRFWAAKVSKHLPGKPTILVRNLPGGGQITGGNSFAAHAKPDGLTLLASSGTGHFAYLLGDSRVKYDLRKMRTVLASPVGGIVVVRPELGAKGPADIRKLAGAKLKYGSQGATSQDLLSFYAFEQLGLDVAPIMGMRGRNDARLAYERGELNIDYQNLFLYDDQIEPMIKAGKSVPIFTFGMPGPDGGLVRDPVVPDIPHYAEAYEAVHGKKPSGLPWEVYQSFFVAGFGAQKLLSLPEGTPDDIVEAWTSAIKAAMAEPDFNSSKTEVLGPYEQFVGPEAEKMKMVATTVTPEARTAVISWLKERFNANVD